jgi:hypothetical protein
MSHTLEGFSWELPNLLQSLSIKKVKDRKGMAVLFGQLFLDQFVAPLFIYFPAFYAAREVVMTAEKPVKCSSRRADPWLECI